MNSPFPSFYYVIKPLTYRTWLVIKNTEEDEEEYFVRYDEKGWKCTCKGWIFRGECKHIRMVKEYLATSKCVYYEKDLYLL